MALLASSLIVAPVDIKRQTIGRREGGGREGERKKIKRDIGERVRREKG